MVLAECTIKMDPFLWASSSTESLMAKDTLLWVMGRIMREGLGIIWPMIPMGSSGRLGSSIGGLLLIMLLRARGLRRAGIIPLRAFIRMGGRFRGFWGGERVIMSLSMKGLSMSKAILKDKDDSGKTIKDNTEEILSMGRNMVEEHLFSLQALSIPEIITTVWKKEMDSSLIKKVKLYIVENSEMTFLTVKELREMMMAEWRKEIGLKVLIRLFWWNESFESDFCWIS